MKTRADGALVPVSATVAVCTQPANTGVTPCTPTATLYTDATLATPCTGTLKDGSLSGATNCSNPLITDSKGNYHFYAKPADGPFTIQVSGSGIVTSFEPDVAIAGSLSAGVPLGAITSSSVNTSVYVAPSAGMAGIQTAINALPSGGGEVQLSPGTYTGSVGIIPKNGTHIRCTNTGWANTYDVAGCVLQPTTGNAIWAVTGPGSGTLTNFKMTDVTIDLTADSSALGCVNMVRSLYTEMYDIRCLLPTLGAMDGFRFDGTAFSYWNNCYACKALSVAPGAIANTHVGFHYTAAANSNYCFGCIGNLVGTSFLIDGATSQVGLFGGGADKFKDNCISFQGTSRGNAAINVRCEEIQAPTGAACNFGATVLENRCEHIYVVGAPSAAAVVTDSSSGKNYIYMDDTSGQYVNIVLGSSGQAFQMGLNKTPSLPGTFGLDIHGQLQSDNYWYNQKAGDFRLHALNSSSVLTPILTQIGAAGADVVQLTPNGTGGVYLATSGGASAFGFQPSSFGNAFVPAADNTYAIGANTRRWSDIRFAAAIKPGSDNVLISSTAPTIAGAGCGGSAATIATNNGTAAFSINVGTAPTSAGCVVTMPAAAAAWNCYATDITTNSTSVDHVKQTATGSTSVTLVNFSDVSVATAPTANDIWQVSCFAR